MAVEVRPAAPADVPQLLDMTYALAEYQRAREHCHLTAAQLTKALFEPAPTVHCHVAVLDGEPVGMALWFRTFSTWEGVHCLYLEDLFVRPEARGEGVGKSLVAALASVCLAEGYPRLEWGVLDWNPARGFYEALGAEAKPGWLPFRLSGAALAASGSADASDAQVDAVTS